jgi:hypothetical protein
VNLSTRSAADGTTGAALAPNCRTGSGRGWVTSVVALILAACSSTSVPGASGTATGASGSPNGIGSSPPGMVAAPALDCEGAANARAIWFRAGDGTRLYGAIIGSGRVGVVVANDVPHPLCETLTVARFLGGRGNRVLVFDYRDRVDELRSRGVARVILLGSYAGVAAAVVAATEIDPPVDGVIGISPAAVRGQWVEGPFGPIGAFRAAPRVRVPALYISVRSDRYVPLGEVRRLYRLTASQDKDLVVIPSGSGGFDTIDFSSYEGRVRTAILSFVRHVAG